MAVLTFLDIEQPSPRSVRSVCIASGAQGVRVLFASLVLLVCLNSPAHAAPSEADIEVGFIHNIAKFVEWPAALPEGGKLQLCIIGQSDMESSAAVLVGKPIGQQTWAVRRVTMGDKLRDCQVLYIAGSEKVDLRHILKNIQGGPVLTVGDTEGYAEQGVMVNFYLEEGKLRFEVNLDSVRRSRLKIGARLLKLARIVPVEVSP